MSSPETDGAGTRGSVSTNAPPTGWARLGAHGVIVAVLASAAVAPLSYYLGSDPYDERFAWRMFSGVRLRSCQIQVVETPSSPEGSPPLPFDPGETVHAGFVNLLRRARGAVVDGFLEARCDRSPRHPDEVRYRNRCFTAGGDALPVIEVVRDCRTGVTAWP